MADPATPATSATHPEAGSTGGAALASLAQAADQLARIATLVEENEALSEEVCRNYEQIHILIDFTCEIAGLTSLSEIEARLVARVVALLGAAKVALCGMDGTWRRYCAGEAGGAAPLPGNSSKFEPLLADGRSVAGVTVRNLDGARVLVCPLKRLDGRVDVMFIERPAGSQEFTSSDVRFVETLLSFGGQILCNAELHERIRRASMDTTRALVSAIDKKDPYTSGHSERVGFLSRRLSEALGQPLVQVEQLEWAGLLHDVGKIGLPEDILNKPGKLTPEEFEIVKKHPEMGYEILKHIQSYESILDGVLYHHEQPDGGGYPRGLRRDAIPIAAAIIHVADVFDALTSARSYRAKFTVEQALGIMRTEAGTKLDGDLVPAFIDMFERLRLDDPQRFAAVFPHLNGGVQ